MITVQELNNSEDNYNWWLTIMPDTLMSLSLLPNDLRGKLDFSISSLTELENYLLKNYTLDSIRDKKNKMALDVFTRYAGETFRKNIKNIVWKFQDDPKFIDYGYPIITKNDNVLFTSLNPASFVVAALDRQKGDYIFNILKNIVDDEKIF